MQRLRENFHPERKTNLLKKTFTKFFFYNKYIVSFYICISSQKYNFMHCLLHKIGNIVRT